MIELTQEQSHALQQSANGPPRIVDPRTNETFVLLSVEEYKRLKEDEYDDSPWKKEELEAIAWQTIDQSGWEEYDDPAEKP